MKKRRPLSEVVFLDFALNTLLGFVALFIIAYVQINPAKKENVPVVGTEGKFAVIMQWEGRSADDVDLYVKDPLGNVAYFRNRDVGLMHLEHDDLGAKSDTVTTGSGDVKIDRNEERVIIREIVPGEYVVNTHMYSKADPAAAKVTVLLFRLRGEDAELVKKERTLAANGDEATAFRFTLSEDGSVTGISELPQAMVGKLAGRSDAPFFPRGGFAP